MNIAICLSGSKRTFEEVKADAEANLFRELQIILYKELIDNNAV